MKLDLTNESYEIMLTLKRSSERYYRDSDGWTKVSSRGRSSG